MCQNLFEFSRHPLGLIEPTNNAAERALRHPVIWKQLSFGTQSAAGSRFVETLLTIAETCRQQGRDSLQFLVDAVDARFHNRPAPLLNIDGARTATLELAVYAHIFPIFLRTSLVVIPVDRSSMFPSDVRLAVTFWKW